jgi:hypothetical protein
LELNMEDENKIEDVTLQISQEENPPDSPSLCTTIIPYEEPTNNTSIDETSAIDDEIGVDVNNKFYDASDKVQPSNITDQTKGENSESFQKPETDSKQNNNIGDDHSVHSEGEKKCNLYIIAQNAE